MRWKDKLVHVLDFEGNARTGVIEYGVATLSRGKLQSVATGLCCGRQEPDSDEIRVHGIKHDMISTASSFEEEWKRFSNLRATGSMAAHHASVEDNLLKGYWPYPRWNKSQKKFSWGPWIDTHRIYAFLYKGLENYRLSTLIKIFALGERLSEWGELHCPPERRKAHCALYDALASALLLIRLDELAELNDLTTDWLLELSATDQHRRDNLRQGDLFLS
tara:strand:- start:13127 stop:13783 length:657 start_codon:yes stop_codon:yes gene_type:complete